MTSLSDKDRRIFRELRANARINLTDVADKTGIPVSTVYDRVRHNERIIVKKHTTLLDFTKLGYQARAFIALKVEPKDHAVLMAYLNGNANVNSLWRVNYGYTCVAEVVMPTVAHVEDFLQLLQANFSIVEKHVFNIIDDIKREEFVP